MLLFPTDPNDIQKVCEDDFQLRCRITKFLTWGLLTVLITWEFLQFLSKILTGELDEYFSWQNMIELLMLNLSISFFVIQYLDPGDAEKSGRQEHLLGWALFLAWIDLTMFLGRFDLFGRHIYRSWHVMKNVAWSMTVYIPVLMAKKWTYNLPKVSSLNAVEVQISRGQIKINVNTILLLKTMLASPSC